MSALRHVAGFAAAFGVIAGFAASPAVALEPVKDVRLYVFDCGHAHFNDFGMFADTGEYDGKPGDIADPCFLVRHPKGILIWDTGLGDSIAAHPEGVDAGSGIHLTVPVTLASQLEQVGIAVGDVDFVAFSHFHFDHTGNANLFAKATWIVNSAALAWAIAEPAPFGVNPTTFSAYRSAKQKVIDGDDDVFGDGSVRILKAPGHTPGHQVLEVRLRKAGTIVLSGDLYHTRANRENRRVPAFNASRADTLASIDRIEKIVRNTHARFVVQHDSEDFKALPKPPAFLE